MDTLDGFSNYLAMNERSEATKKNYLRTVKGCSQSRITA